MSKGIEVSPKHGVNPTIPVCFFCGEDKNEIALLGRLRERNKTTGRAVPGSDVEAPRRMVIDYEPCDKCKAKFDLGVALIGVVDHQPDDGRPPLTAQGGAKVYPTGSFCVLTEEGAQRMFKADFKKGQIVFIDHNVLGQITT